MWAAIFLVNTGKINKKYFDIIKSLYMHKFKSKRFKRTRFRIRKRKVLHTHRKILRTVLLIVCMGDFYLNLRQAPLVQVQPSNWSIAYTYATLVILATACVFDWSPGVCLGHLGGLVAF